MSPRRPPAPKPPKTLDAAAKARWRAVVPSLVRRGAVDIDTLATYCQVWARWRAAEQGIASSGQLVRNEKGRAVGSPLLPIANQAGSQVRALERQLGISSGEMAAASTDPAPTAAGPLLTRRELAGAFNVHMMSVTKWEQDGMPIEERGSRGHPSRYSELAVRRWLSQRDAKNSGVVDLTRERARQARAQAILAEQTLAVRARQLLPVEEVEKVWAAEVAAVRTKLLGLPTTLADRLHQAAVSEGVESVEAVLEEAIQDVLVELAAPAGAAGRERSA